MFKNLLHKIINEIQNLILLVSTLVSFFILLCLFSLVTHPRDFNFFVLGLVEALQRYVGLGLVEARQPDFPRFSAKTSPMPPGLVTKKKIFEVVLNAPKSLFFLIGAKVFLAGVQTHTHTHFVFAVVHTHFFLSHSFECEDLLLRKEVTNGFLSLSHFLSFFLSLPSYFFLPKKKSKGGSQNKC